jgi:hypothetical protein
MTHSNSRRDWGQRRVVRPASHAEGLERRLLFAAVVQTASGTISNNCPRHRRQRQRPSPWQARRRPQTPGRPVLRAAAPRPSDPPPQAKTVVRRKPPTRRPESSPLRQIRRAL